MHMAMKFVGKIMKDAGVENPNQLARKVGVDRPLVDRWLTPTARKMDFGSLIKLRRLAGWSWSRLGQELEEEFGEEA
jgi:hypothetical protein